MQLRHARFIYSVRSLDVQSWTNEMCPPCVASLCHLSFFFFFGAARSHEPKHTKLKNTVHDGPIIARFWYIWKARALNSVAVIKARVNLT